MPHETLYAAIAAGDLPAVDRELEAVRAEAALALGPAIREVVNEAGRTLAGWAAQHGQVGVLERLHASGVDVDAPDGRGVRPAHLAAYNGHGQVLRWLVEHGADLNAQDVLGLVPAHFAARYGHADALRTLGELGADLNAPNQAGAVPALYAARNGHADALRVLGARGADLNARTHNGYVPAYFAARNGHVNALRALAEFRVDLAACDGNGRAPGYCAAERGAVDVLTCLQSLEVDLDAPDAQGNRPIHGAAVTGQVASLDSLYGLGWGVDLNSATRKGYTPANLAARHGHTEFLQRLREHGVDLSQSPADGMAPAQVAAEHDQIDTLAAMIRWGVAMPQTWPAHLAEVGPQRVNQAAVAAALAELEGSKDVNHTNRARDLQCSINFTAFGTEGPQRPVRWIDGSANLVLSDAAATEILSGPTPKHPTSSRVFTAVETVALMTSGEYVGGDPERLAKVRAARDEMLAGAPDEGRLGRLMGRGPDQESQWQTVVRLDQERQAAGIVAGAGAGAGAAPARTARCVIS